MIFAVSLRRLSKPLQIGKSALLLWPLPRFLNITAPILIGVSAPFSNGQAEESYEPYTPLCRGEGATSDDLHHCFKSMLPFHPLLRGLYAEQLERWLRVFDRSQILILDSAEMLLDFAGAHAGRTATSPPSREVLVSAVALAVTPSAPYIRR